MHAIDTAPTQEHPMKAHREPLSIEARAQRRVRRKMGFFIHAFIFLAVNLGFFALSQFGLHHPRAHFFPMGWALGLAIHGLVTLLSLQGEGLRRRMLEQEMLALRRAES
jgi:hypothetical protein